jgi:hypothetical protein
MSLRSDADDEELLRFVEDWIDDLARGDYASAFERTKHDAYYRWTPALIEQVIGGYGLPKAHPSGVRFTVTPRDLARGRPYHRHVEREGARLPVVAWLQYDLPLNGQWSDLTASFRVERGLEGLTVVLEDIHVY